MTLTLKINRVHPLPEESICVRLDVSMIIALSSKFYAVHKDLKPKSTVTLTLKINIIHPLPMGNICGRFDVSMIITLSSMLFTRIRTHTQTPSHTHKHTLTHTLTHGSNAISPPQLCCEGIIKATQA